MLFATCAAEYKRVLRTCFGSGQGCASCIIQFLGLEAVGKISNDSDLVILNAQPCVCTLEAQRLYFDWLE